jgi:hypothetical protein
VPPIVVHGLEVQAVSPQRAVPPLREARGPPRQYAYRHLDGTDGSEDKAGTDRGMSVTWSPAIQRPLHQGVERLTCSPTPEPASAEVPLVGGTQRHVVATSRMATRSRFPDRRASDPREPAFGAGRWKLGRASGGRAGGAGPSG